MMTGMILSRIPLGTSVLLLVFSLSAHALNITMRYDSEESTVQPRMVNVDTTFRQTSIQPRRVTPLRNRARDARFHCKYPILEAGVKYQQNVRACSIAAINCPKPSSGPEECFPPDFKDLNVSTRDSYLEITWISPDGQYFYVVYTRDAGGVVQSRKTHLLCANDLVGEGENTRHASCVRAFREDGESDFKLAELTTIRIKVGKDCKPRKMYTTVSHPFGGSQDAIYSKTSAFMAQCKFSFQYVYPV